jgi:hypothetical protein
VDFLTAAEAQLQNLFEACDVVTGSDTSFGSLQPAHFSSNFNLERSGLLQALRPFLLDEKQDIEAEICELNVYGTPFGPLQVFDFRLERVLVGKGSRSEGVKDARVSERMFASLVISFPTRYEGGNMLLRHLQDEYSANKLNDSSFTRIAYTAYFCDVKRTVSPIISGHCVMLKYNLYLRDLSVFSGLPSYIPCTTWNELTFREKLSKLLSDPTFLPAGGKLGFSLLNHYPISVHQGKEDDRVFVSSVLPPLKGIDAVVKHVCEEFSLLVTPCIVYNTSRALIMSDKVYVHEFTEYDTKILLENDHDVLKQWSRPYWDMVDLDWVLELRSYGNDNVSWVPGGLCLSVDVGPTRKRATI